MCQVVLFRRYSFWIRTENTLTGLNVADPQHESAVAVSLRAKSSWMGVLGAAAAADEGLAGVPAVLNEHIADSS